jgi:glycosyltransferase involved in cell wall biosynthesis
VCPKLSVVLSSLNGAPGVDRCLHALAHQTIRSILEIIVVDDGSTDATSDVGRAHAAIVVRHATNRGLAAARNSGLNAASAPIVAFLDDDCEPEPQWAERLLAGYGDGVFGVGGTILPQTGDGLLLGYLERNNPLKPLEANLEKSNRLPYRLRAYLQRQWATPEDLPSRRVYSLAGANMSFLRQALLEVGQFDERFTFGGEELDLCMRMKRSFPAGRLVFIPEVRVVHHFNPSILDTLRRSRAYGRGSARLYRKWPAVPPTFFPGPLVALATLLACARRPSFALAAVAIPHLLYPQGARHSIVSGSGLSLLDAYVQLAQESCENIGFIEGLWSYRHLMSEPETEASHSVAPQDLQESPGRVPGL